MSEDEQVAVCVRTVAGSSVLELTREEIAGLTVKVLKERARSAAGCTHMAKLSVDAAVLRDSDLVEAISAAGGAPLEVLLVVQQVPEWDPDKPTAEQFGTVEAMIESCCEEYWLEAARRLQELVHPSCGPHPLTRDSLATSIGLLARLLQVAHGDATLESAIQVAESICAGVNPGGIEAILNGGIFPRLVELLSHPARGVRAQALRAVGDIASGDDDQTQALLDCKVLPKLRSLFNGDESKVVKKDTLWTISNVLAGNTHQIQAVMEAGFMELVFRALQNEDEELLQEGVWCVSNAASGGTEEQRRALTQPPCLSLMAGLLDTQREKVQAGVLEFFDHVAPESPTDAAADAIRQLLTQERLERLQDADASARARKLLARLYPEADEEASSESPRRRVRRRVA